jgi:uncharacterized circularly permuted ATP-grasp superfamily protein
MLRGAIDHYHSLLTDELGAECQAQLDRQHELRGLHFGERPLCTVLRPRFLVPGQYRFCQERASIILGAFGKAHRRGLVDPVFRAQFGLEGWEEALLVKDPLAESPSPTARLDAFFVSAEHGLRFTEYNAETPAGAGYNDVLTEVFDGLPIMRPFLQRFQLRPLPARAHTMHALLGAYQEWAGRSAPPRIGILDWREVPTHSEFMLFEQYFAAQGLPCVIADPREVEYRNGRLMAGDFHITLIYKRVLITELIERCGMDSPVVRAVTDGAVLMANGFACKMLHKKASLAVLSDERNAEMFTEAEQAAISANIPWSRVVEDRRTVIDDQDVSLLEFAAAHREEFVLKPNDAYGGEGILLGWECSDEQWQEGLRTALREPYIVQRRIAIPSSPFPSLVDGRVVLAERMLDTAPYVFGGRYVDGCLTRLSTASLLNVTAGGGSSVPTYLVERR